MPYDGNKYSAEKMVTDSPRPITRAEEAASKWAAAFNFRVRCEIDLQEATARMQTAVSQEQAAWEEVEVAAQRRPETAQAPEIGSLRPGSIGQGGQMGRAY